MTTLVDAAKLQAERDAAEAIAYKEDPDGLSALRTKRAQERREAELRQKEETIAERERRLSEEAFQRTAAAKESLAAAIAAEHKVSKETLLKFTDGSEAAMRELAAQLPKIGAGAGGGTVVPDSGRSSGGAGQSLAQAQENYLKNPTPETRAAYIAVRPY